MITGIHHISFTVSNIDEAVIFFRDILGLKTTAVRESGGPLTDKIIKLAGTKLRIAHVTTPDGGNVELIQYLSPQGETIDLKTCNTGVAHLAFYVDDIQKMYEKLRAKNLRFNNPPVWLEVGPLKGYGVCYFRGPDGIMLELMQSPKGVKLDSATGFVFDR